MPKVSIIIPVYNVGQYIPKCLDSLINQTLSDIEIICINDCSLDNSLEVLRSYEQKDSRVKVITQENLKQGAARNKGTKIAQGEYIGYIDSDDWVDLDYFEKLYAAAKRFEADIALATNVRIGNKKTKKRLNIKTEQFVTSLQDKFDICNHSKNECPTNKIYKRDFLFANDITYPEGVYCEDKLFTTKAVYFANGIVTVPGVNYYYYRNPNSTVNRKDQKHSKCLIRDKNNARMAVLNFLKEQHADVEDGTYWAVQEEKRFFGIAWYKVLVSLKTKKVLLFGVVIKECAVEVVEC